jgi:hypothetical protein
LGGQDAPKTTPEDIKSPNAWIWIAPAMAGRVPMPMHKLARGLGMVRILRSVIVIGLLLSFDMHVQAQVIQDAPLRARIGGGNLTTFLAGPPSAPLYAALHGVGAPRARMNSYGWRSLDRTPTPKDFDAAMLEAYKNAISPVILLDSRVTSSLSCF